MAQPDFLLGERPFDLIFCRNLLIYLAPAQQRKIIPLLHFALNPGGFLFLGSFAGFSIPLSELPPGRGGGIEVVRQ